VVALSLFSGQLQKVVIDFFYPRYCVGCGKLGSFLCMDCTKTLPRISSPTCQKCGKPETTGTYCAACWGTQLTIDSIRSPFRFEGAIRKAIHAFKYSNLRAICTDLSNLMHDYFQDSDLCCDVVVPVPLHLRRLRNRGYNQSALLARGLSRLAGLKVIENCLYRHKDSVPQTRTATVEERKTNTNDAFVCRIEELAAKRVLLIDDVCTSGATLEACAVALKEKGVESICGLTLAREV
jgi:ComF family protein